MISCIWSCCPDIFKGFILGVPVGVIAGVVLVLIIL